MNKKVLKIALIGDIHFGSMARCNEFAVPGIPVDVETERAAPIKDGLINLFTEKSVEYVFVAGDLTSSGNPLELIFCNTLLNEISTRLGVSHDKRVICLGNHDVDWELCEFGKDKIQKISGISDELRRKGDDAYKQIGSHISDIFMSTNKYTETGPVPCCGFIEYEELIVYTLNSSWMSSKGDSVKYGRLSEDQIEWFENSVQSKSSCSKWKLLLLHHHPLDYQGVFSHKDFSTLAEGPRLLKIAADNGFSVVCHGHKHHPRAVKIKHSDWASSLVVVCAGSVAVNLKHRGDVPNTAHILELHTDIQSDEKFVIVKNYQYRQGDGWTPVQMNSNVTPIDDEMLFNVKATNPDFKSLLDSIMIRKNGSFKIPRWELLPTDLRELGYHKIHTLIHSSYDAEYDIQGNAKEGYLALVKEVI